MKIYIENPDEQILERKADSSGRISIGRKKYGNKKVCIAVLEIL